SVITLFVLFLWRVGDIAEACKCPTPNLQLAFCNADVVIRAKVIGVQLVSGNIHKYDIKQIKMFKGPDRVIHAVFTASSPAACGVTLQINKEYLFIGAIIPCSSLPCPTSSLDECLWTDWGTDNGQNLVCIKSRDGSCAWK
ncbi:unnamed protein product, partial [Coregonus sp. 'balchen']